MKIRRILIFAIPVVLAGIGFILWRRMKKKKEALGEEVEEETLTKTVTKTVPSAISPAIKMTQVREEPVAKVGASVVKPSFKVLKVLKCGSTGKAIAQVSKTTVFKKGDNVKVDTPLYKGTFKIWYIYNRAANVTNLYLETPYKGSATGTLTKV